MQKGLYSRRASNAALICGSVSAVCCSKLRCSEVQVSSVRNILAPHLPVVLMKELSIRSHFAFSHGSKGVAADLGSGGPLGL